MNNIKVFWGSDHKVGTTMLAQAFAEKLAESEKKVLVIDFSVRSGDVFYEEEMFSLSDLRKRLSSRLITKENFMNYTMKGDSIYKINGLTDIKSMFNYTSEMVYELIDIASEVFDEVIIDSGTGLDSPITLAALRCGGKNIFVLSQQESAIRSWESMSDSMSNIGAVPELAVINKFFKGDRYNQGYISQRTGLPQNIFRTVTESEFGIQAEADRKTFLFYGDKQFEKEIRSLDN